MENDFLVQIVKQLDEDYQIEGDEEEIELKILQKISSEIEELISSNEKLRLNCT